MCPFWCRYFWWGGKRALNLFWYGGERGANIATISVRTTPWCRRTHYYMLRHINFNALILTKQITICNMLWTDNVFYYGFCNEGFTGSEVYILYSPGCYTQDIGDGICSLYRWDDIKFNRTWSTKLCRIVGFAYFDASKVFCALSTCTFFFV